MANQEKLDTLQQPTKLDTVLAEQRTAFTGMGFYTYYSGREQLQQRKREIMRSGSRFGLGARKFGLVMLSGSLVGVGVYRLFN